MIDLEDAPEQAEFRARLRSWLAANMPTEAMPTAFDLRQAYLHDWYRKLAEGGWIGLSWPKEFGGGGFGALEEAIFNEELGSAAAPPGPSLGYIGRALFAYGTEEQRSRYLPSMLASTEPWCQGFSEPGAGSDLAAIQTRAVETDTGYLITGQKVWTSYAQFADYCLLLARTSNEGPKHKGITAFIVDMHAPGIDIRPIVQITGDTEFCEIFLDETPVPRENILGELNGGWDIAMMTVSFERGPVDIGFQAHYTKMLAKLRAVVRDRGKAEDQGVRRKLAAASVAVDVLRMHSLRSLAKRVDGSAPGSEGSIDKILMSSAEQHLFSCANAVLAPAALLDDREWFDEYLYSRGASVYGGTREIQKNILATRVLGLPRS